MPNTPKAHARRMADRLAAGDLCSEAGCRNPRRTTSGLCTTHYNRTLPSYGAPPKDMERRRASWRAKNRRRREGRRFSDISPADELKLRIAAKRCPIPKCGVKLTDEPFLPNSKELDRMITGYMGGGYTGGNVRIICRACNLSRPKDGRDFVGQPTLWAADPEFVPRQRRQPRTCEHGVALSRVRCYDCQPLKKLPSRQAEGRRAAELRADGWQWRAIAEAMGVRPSNAGAMARKYGDPAVVAQWPPDDPHCEGCGADLPRGGVGRPRKYCTECRPVVVTPRMYYE